MIRIAGAVFSLLITVAAQAAPQTSTWNTDFGPVSLTIDGRNVTGAYTTYKGAITGQVIGDEIAATWLQPTSEKRCPVKLHNTSYWGTVRWKVQPNGTMTGSWSYCSEAPGTGGKWNGTLTSGTAMLSPPTAPPPASRTANRPVKDIDVHAVFDTHVRLGDVSKAQVLKGDFTCDGVEDRALGYLDLTNPDKSEYLVMIVTTKGDKYDGDIVRFGFGQSQDNICSADNVTIEAEASTKADAKAFTGEDVCHIGIRVDDQSCDSPRVYWRLRGGSASQPGSRLAIGRN